MMMMTMSDLELLHDVKNKFALLSFLYEDDCSLMGYEILFIFSLYCCFIKRQNPLTVELSVMQACLLSWTQETKYCGWRRYVMEARVVWDSVFFCN